MNDIVFVIGGCRSGKSRYALTLADKYLGKKKIFVATCIPGDDEMLARVELHKKERSSSWISIEAPYDLDSVLKQYGQGEYVVLVDCLTLWVSNIMLQKGLETLNQYLANLIEALQTVQSPVIFVSNEVGAGIVPDNKLAREFRDAVGFVNQKIASVSQTVIWMVAGIPVKIQ